jgi:hypothetical protein
MPNILHALIVEEVSLVDHPSNAEIDPRTGRKRDRAVVAFFKRDGDLAKNNNRKEQPKMSKFERILKSGTATRDQICQAVAKKAFKIAKRANTEVNSEILAQAWSDGAYEAYENAPVPAARRPAPPLVQVTKAEVTMDSLARKKMSTDGLQYSQACSKILTENPSLYSQYCRELAAGETVTAPDPSKLDVGLEYVIKRGAQAQEDGVCSRCDEAVDDGDSFCASCGESLDAQRAAAKGKKAKK